jgi:hypothetical protein
MTANADYYGGKPSVDRVYSVELQDAAGVTHASVEKTVYIRKNR